MEDWRNRQDRRLEQEALRAHCQIFSRLGWALGTHLAVMLAVQLLGMAVAGLVAPRVLTDPVFQWALSACSAYAAAPAAFWLVLRKVPRPLPERGALLSPPRFFQVYLIILGLMYATNVATLALLDAVGALLGQPISNPVEQMDGYPMALNILLGCVLAPVVEELMFRRLLLDRLRPYGDRFAVAASALCFGLYHGNLHQLFYACAIGLVLGYAALRTGRLWQVMLLHAMVNALSSLVIPLLEPLGEAGDVLLTALVLGSMAAGLTLLVRLRETLCLRPGAMGLTEGWTWRLFFENPGMLFFCLLALSLCALYLLPGMS